MKGSVRGYVMTEGGVAVEGATVVIVKGPGPAPDIAPMSDRNGSFVLDGLPEGTYLLRAFGPDEQTGETSVSIYDNSVTDAEIVLSSA
jgi:hypothetical protein